MILDREQGGDKMLAKAGYKLHSLGTLSEVWTRWWRRARSSRRCRRRWRSSSQRTSSRRP